MNYTIAFSFSVESGTMPLNAVVNITDGKNTFSLAGGPVQIQPYSSPATPALSMLKVGVNNIMVAAAANSGAASLQVTAVVDAVGASMAVNLSYDSVVLTANYFFPGYAHTGALNYGNNVITFPG